MKCLKKYWERVSDEKAHRSGVPTVRKVSGTHWGETFVFTYHLYNSLLFKRWYIHHSFAERQKRNTCCLSCSVSFKAFTYSVLWQARACDASSLLVCSAINYSCSKKGFNIKMWWYKHRSVCFPGLLVHFTVLSLLTFLPHHLHRLPESLAPRAKEAHAVFLYMLPSNNYFASFLTLAHFGIYPSW